LPQPLSPRILIASFATLLAIAVGGCAPSTGVGTGSSTTPSAGPALPTIPYAPSTTSKSPAPQAVDYRRLMLTAADLTDAADTFTERSNDPQPNGHPGASAFFVNAKDNRAIADTFLIYPDAATASATLKQAAATLPTLVAGGTPGPLAVGADGVTISGSYPVQAKSATLVFFTEGRAMVRLEFQSAQGDATTPRFVLGVAKMQDIALRIGLAEPQ
jgi:hypothetical protein